MTFYELIPSVLSTFDKLQSEASIKNGAILREQRTVPVWTLSTLYDKHCKGTEIDLLSIDAEGLDFAILSGNDWQKNKPRLIVFEANENSDTTSETDALLLVNGYRMIKQLGCNKVYERN